METQKPTVLIIDDETDTLTMFRLFLSSYGYKVLVAEDGYAGLALVTAEKPAIVFTDLKMPGMDGFEVLKQIKKIAPRTEVIVITGHSDMDLVIQALNLDTTDFINKPISPEAVEAALQRAMERLQRPMARSGKVSFDLKQGVGRIRVEGTLRRENRKDLFRCRQQALKETKTGILLHFMENAAVNGAGITDLITCLSAFRQNNQAVAVTGLSENFKAIFKMVGVNRFASIYDRECDALAALKSDKPEQITTTR